MRLNVKLIEVFHLPYARIMGETCFTKTNNDFYDYRFLDWFTHNSNYCICHQMWYKWVGNFSYAPIGCLVGCLIMFWFVFCAVGGCSQINRNQAESYLAHIKLLTTGAVVKILKSELIGADFIYREKNMSIRMIQEGIWLNMQSNIRLMVKA